jgi:hypothetical protein
MPRFRNTRSGRVVDVPDLPTTRLGHPKRDKMWAEKLAGMQRSRRWERVEADEPIATVAPADVRAWARAQGIEVSVRGKLPDELVDQYVAAQGDG